MSITATRGGRKGLSPRRLLFVKAFRAARAECSSDSVNADCAPPFCGFLRAPLTPGVTRREGHTITEPWNVKEWEGTVKIIEIRPPRHGQGHLPPHQAAQSPVQPGFEHCRGWGIRKPPSATSSSASPPSP